MRCRHTFHAPNNVMAGNGPEIGDCEMRKFWRELARLITLSGEASPTNLLVGQIGEFFGKWRARQDSTPFRLVGSVLRAA